MKFKLVSDFVPTGDQPEAIEKLVAGLKEGLKHQVLLGVTGSGKTFTMANVVACVQKPTLVISHNKTLAAQLYQEFRDFFPQNAVCYFVSYYDYYQPEAYIPSTDIYIEKETEINEEIDKLRLSATTNLLTREDTIVVASVSSIYNLGSPVEYGHFVLELRTGLKLRRESILKRLTELQYERSDYGFGRSTFRVRGDTIDLFPAYSDLALRIEMEGDYLKKLTFIDPVSGSPEGKGGPPLSSTIIYPAKHYLTDPDSYQNVFAQIRKDLKIREEELKAMGKDLEAKRLEQRTNYDLEMIAEVGYVNGIENYSRYFDGRAPGEPPYTLLDYFPRDFLLIIDESHMTIPQIRGMANGDRSRKEVLIEYGFRLPSALDNRPLKFEEFLRKVKQIIYASATPDNWEISLTQQYTSLTNSDMPRRPGVVEQLIRPTGLVDPEISLRKTSGQVGDLIKEIKRRVKKKERVLVTTLTKRMAEELATYLADKGIKVHYLHSEIETLDRTDILEDLRTGVYDVVVGINLLREGLDLPEVSLVAILDADKEGFLRSKTSLIQVMGRAARHIRGEVIMYADTVTGSMKEAISEIGRRRNIQLEYNKKHKIIPKTIQKPIRSKLVEREEEKNLPIDFSVEQIYKEKATKGVLLPDDRKKLIEHLSKKMREAAQVLDFETAALLRDQIRTLKNP